MSILIVILIVVVIVALAMWAIYYIPFPPGSPTFIKPLLYVIVLVVAIIFLLMKSGMAQQPVPTLKPSKPVAAGPAAAGKQIRAAAPNWQRFKGATRCEQIGARITCDNGYTTTAR